MIDTNSFDDGHLDLAGITDVPIDQDGLGHGPAQSGSVPSSATDLIPATTATTYSVTPGGYITGSIDSAGDHDWYRVTLNAGQTYTISTQLSLTLSDSVLALRDSTGALIAENDDVIFGGNLTWSEITYTATTTGTYYIDTSGYQSDTGTFYLTMSSPAFDSALGSTATTASLAVGGSATGAFESTGDHDWYAIQLAQGQSYLLTTSTESGVVVDTVLYLRDASGNPLAYNDDGLGGGGFSRIRFTAPTTGTYYVDVGVWGNQAETAGYKVNASIAPPLPLYTNDQIATQLTSTYWSGSSRHFDVAPGGTLKVDLTALTPEGQTLAREALKLWTDASGINFSEVASGGQIVFDDNQSGAFSNSVTNGSGLIVSSTVNVSTTWISNYGSGLRTYSLQTYIHEIGHALGLGHAGNYNTTATYPDDVSYLNDDWATSIMSYFDQRENTYFANLGFTKQFVATPMAADIIAIANLYGANTLTRTGDTVYGFGNTTGRDAYDAAVGSSGVSFTIIDNGGIDTVNFSGYSSNARVDLNPEAFSNVGNFVGNMVIARGTIIENAITGSGTDVLIGNAANNRLEGGTGIDQFYGGAGNDTFVVDQQGELVFENAGEGTDTVESSANYYLFGNIERLTLTGTAGLFGVGNELDNLINGNAGQNLLLGGLGNDEIHGGDARDSIFGEGGADNLFGDAGVDYIVAGIGNDTLDGGADADEMYGEDGNDTLWGGLTFDTDIMVGGNGDDILHGDSGLGDYDRMYGNLGNDTFYVDTPADLVFEQLNEGIDTVYAGINGAGYYLYDNIENLVLTGQTPFGVGNALDNNLTGNAIGNYLLGGDGNDVLNGKGGNDVLFGQAGSDTFVFDAGNGQDVIGDFQHGSDRIQLIGSLTTFAQVQNSFHQNGSDGAIDLGGGNFIVLQGVQLSTLTASDFLFG
ncbi:M10 family metallopeptidase C-terminal domain-containing protein [Novosphingobium aquiterrae]|uniref:M10 family metallopeptidase C-terminal domain-containing protein n=1 Tax=Novosphingobium aquiterrae TaxID=624388 RepID=A0ABV6PFH6_9SPHN